MFPRIAWDFPPTLGWENPPFSHLCISFWQFCGIGTLLDYSIAWTANRTGGHKWEFDEMSAKSQLTRTLVAIAGALLMSTVAVTAAVTPLQANAGTVRTSLNA
jgi:hypothetical protein